MRKIAVLALLVGAVFLFSAQSAQAHEDGKPHAKKDHAMKDKIKCEEKKKHEGMKHDAMHQMMLETHAIMLETIKLVGKTAMDEETAQKAEALGHRLEDLIQKHKEMHAQMMGGAGEMPMHDHDMKMKPMEHKEMKEHKDESEKRQNGEEF
jgi:hypothetical protein